MTFYFYHPQKKEKPLDNNGNAKKVKTKVQVNAKN
jgi:hypothetical protein